MLDSVFNSQKNVLAPMSESLKFLFGLIMVLTVTCSFSALEPSGSKWHP